MPRQPTGTWRLSVTIVLLMALCVGVFGNALNNPFIVDDKPAILYDARVSSGELLSLITRPYWDAPDSDLLYRPLVSLSYGLNWGLSTSAWAFRLPNVLLHGLVTVLVFLLARRLLERYWPALLTAVLFAVHPIHADVLNPIVGRAELSAAFFALVSLLVLHSDGRTSVGKWWFRPVLAAALFGCALLCKESAVTLLGVIVALDALLLPRQPEKRRWLARRFVRAYLPLLLVLAAVLVARVAVLDVVARPAAEIAVVDNPIAHPEHGLAADENAMLARWGTPLAVFGKAVRLLAWPWPLSWDYSYAAIETVRTPGDLGLWMGVLLLLGMLLVAGVAIRRCRMLTFAVALLLITYSIASNTVILIGTVFAERLLYLPSVGWCLAIGAVLACAAEAAKRPVARRALAAATVALVGVSVAYAYLTVERNRDFRSEITLHRADLQTNPRSARLWASLAVQLCNEERFDDAVAAANRAIEILPEYPTGWRAAGIAYWRQGQPRQALDHLRRFFELGGAHHEQAHVAAASIFHAGGDDRVAIALLDEFVRHPAHDDAAGARNNLAWYLLTAQPPDLRDPQRALPLAERAVTLQPGQADYIDTYVTALMAVGKRSEARAYLETWLPRIPQANRFRKDLVEKLSQLGED